MTPPSDLAPGSLELVRRFENTIELPDGADELGTIEGAAGWCLSHGLAPVADAGELERLRAFREALRDVLFANNGEGDAAKAWEGLRSFVGAARLGLVVDPGRGLELSPLDRKNEGALAALLAIVFESLLDRSWFHLRACRKASCRFVYYDRTKNASRAWCNMATCGNQAKAQRRRQRERHSS